MAEGKNITAENPRKIFQDIEYLRGAACILVLVQHIIWTCPLYYLHMIVPDAFLEGSGAVRIFFAISGFVVTYSMRDKLTQFSDGLFIERFGAAKDFLVSFYKKRFFRIMPVVFLVIFGAAIFFASTDYTPACCNVKEWFYDLFRVPFEILFGVYHYSMHLFQWTRRIYDAGFGPMWTLGVESQFYILWPLVLLLCKNNNIRAIVALSFGCLFLFVFGFGTGALITDKLYYLIPNHAAELLLGSFLAFVYDEKDEKEATTITKICAVVLFFAIWIYVRAINSLQLIALPAFYMGVVPSAMSILLVALAVFRPGSFTIPVLKPILGYLGSRSLSFYLIQLLLANVVVWFTGSTYFDAGSMSKMQVYGLQVVIFFVLLPICTELVYRFVEKPARAFGRK